MQRLLRSEHTTGNKRVMAPLDGLGIDEVDIPLVTKVAADQQASLIPRTSRASASAAWLVSIWLVPDSLSALTFAWVA